LGDGSQGVYGNRQSVQAGGKSQVNPEERREGLGKYFEWPSTPLETGTAVIASKKLERFARPEEGGGKK